MKIPKARKLPSGTWFIQLRLGGESVPVTGRTEKECRDRAALIKAEHRAGKREKIAAGADMTLREACQKYIEKKEKARKSPETIRGYDVILRNRFQSAMSKRISSIQSWQQLYNADAEHLSPKTMQNTWAFIRAAVETEAGISLPKIETVTREKKEHAFLDPDQVKAFVKASEGDKYRIALLLALHSCRLSEILAISWSDVDLQDGRIRIAGAVVWDKHGHKVEKSQNKTEGSTRWVPIFIPELTQELSAAHRKTGKLVTANRNTILRHSDAICEAIGAPKVGVHGLRHSFASLCYSLNVPMKITMQVGGWSDPKIVSDIYTHLSQKNINEQVDSLKKFFINANKNANDAK